MRQRLAMVIVLAYLPTASAFAQSGDRSRNYDFQKPLYTVVDVAAKDRFAGWSGDCNSGRPPSAVTLWRIENNVAVNVPATVTYGPRRDAAGWLAATCNRPFDPNVGWSLVPKDLEPAGTFTYVILVNDIPTSWTCGLYPSGYPNAGKTWCDYVANAVYRIVS